MLMSADSFTLSFTPLPISVHVKDMEILLLKSGYYLKDFYPENSLVYQVLLFVYMLSGKATEFKLMDLMEA